MIFWVLIAIYSIEFLGLGYLFPPLKKVPLFLSAMIFLILVFQQNVKEVLKHRQTKLMIAWLLFTFFTILYALITIKAFGVFKAHLGYFILYLSSYLILKNTEKIDLFIWSLVVFHAILIFVNLDKLIANERIGSFTSGYFLGDGNDLGWSICIFFPFTIYLFKTVNNKLTKLFVVFLAALLVFGIISTASRGAFVAFIASCLYFSSISGKKAVSFLIFGICLVIGITLASSTYLNRMESISEYNEDSSIQGRFAAWKAAAMMAVDHPLGVGAGNFSSAYGRFYVEKIDTSKLWKSRRWIAAHSIYFLALGEYGILGLLLLLFLLYSNYSDNCKNLRYLEKQSGYLNNSCFSLSQCLNMSLVAYCVGGIFLGGLNYPHLYIITFLTIRLKSIVEAPIKQLER